MRIYIYNVYLYVLVICHSVVSDSFVTPSTAAHQVSLSIAFSRQEYCSGLHFYLQVIFLTQGSNPGLLHCRWILYHLSHIYSHIYIYIYIYIYIIIFTNVPQGHKILLDLQLVFRKYLNDRYNFIHKYH